MKRQLPIEIIHGTSFFVDVIAEELRQIDEPANRIPFDVFFEDGNGYTFLYDTVTKTSVIDEDEELVQMGRYVWVTMKALMELDPEGISIKYGIPLSVLSSDYRVSDEVDNGEWDDEGMMSDY